MKLFLEGWILDTTEPYCPAACRLLTHLNPAGLLPHLGSSLKTSTSDEGRLIGSPLQLRETALKLDYFFFFLYCHRCSYRGKNGESSRTKVKREESASNGILKSNLVILKWPMLGKFTKEPGGSFSDTVVTGAPPIL